MVDVLWTIYLGLLATASLTFLFKGKYKSKLSKIDFVVSIITWIGLFGYVTETAILNPTVWKFVSVAAFLWDLSITMLLKGYEGEEILEELPIVARRVWMLITFVVMVGPLYYGLFRYAFA
ncbi:hypothetical protein RB620_03065 [Paenibacillus sp. LHD-117]|uniref:hypothetical protein n=1 Tax=Paenibacillus sp. LHD-117 TaxID=3071412 RepID=UPI0027E0AF4B|nr:hypothetical protein [Paenibacillus sp. LHD-117]MDQ6418410.1 hypothetical protein [Paenibacillus sp. LHD-117]